MSEYPRYVSHKRVEAFKVNVIETHGDGTATLWSPGAEYTRRVDGAYVAKHNPQIGGFWVRYEDGYESWSPAHAFNTGYTPDRSAGNFSHSITGGEQP